LRRRLLRKAISLVVVLFVVTAGSFLLTNLLPGNPAFAILGPRATPETVAIVTHDLHLDEPIPVRYGQWLSRVVQGDLGVSYITDQPVATSIHQALPVTIELFVLVQLVAFAIAIPIGTWCAHRADRVFDKVASAGAFGIIAVPQFAIAIVLILVFAVKLHWFKAATFIHLSDDPVGNLRTMVLPTLTLALPLGAIYSRVLRTDMVVTLAQDHITLARASGLPTRRILVGHALRQSSLTLITVFGLQVGGLLGGAIIVEQIFALPGMGRLLFQGIFERDYLLVQGVVMLIAVVYVVANFLVDVVHSLLDPRIRHERAVA